MKQAEDGATSVGVDVGVWYWTQRALDRASVCQLHKANSAGENHGVGIILPQRSPNWSRTDELYFEVDISLPEQTIKALEMSYSNFGIAFDDFEKNIDFKQLAIKTSNGKIRAEVSVFLW